MSTEYNRNLISLSDVPPVLLYATMGEIRRLELSPTASRSTLPRGRRLVNALDYDYAENLLVFGDVHEDAIFSARLAPRARSTMHMPCSTYSTLYDMTICHYGIEQSITHKYVIFPLSINMYYKHADAHPPHAFALRVLWARLSDTHKHIRIIQYYNSIIPGARNTRILPVRVPS